jgi:cytosine/adenosine deaminase-related metal-dependent hydrolase
VILVHGTIVTHDAGVGPQAGAVPGATVPGSAVPSGTVPSSAVPSAIIADGALRIEGERITHVGTSADLLTQFPQEERLDAMGQLVMPGFISAHTRPDHLFARALALLPGVVTLTTRRRALEAALSYEDVRYSTLLSCVNAIRTGTTTLFAYHTSPGVLAYSLDAVAEAVLQTGVRTCLSYGATERESATQARRGIEENARFAQRARREPLLAAAMGLDDVALMSPESLSTAVGAAALSGIGFHVTVGGNLTDDRDRRIARNVGLVALLKRLGVLGPRTVIVHPMDLTHAEMDLLREARIWLVANARGSLERPRSPEPLLTYRDHDLRLALGSSGPSTHMPCEMAALYLLYGQALDGHSLLSSRRDGVLARGLSIQDVLNMGISTNGALASAILGAPLGKLAPGALADIIIVDYPGPTEISAQNFGLHLLSLPDSGRVDTVIVHGRVLMRKGTIRTLDTERIIAHSRELAAALWRRL